MANTGTLREIGEAIGNVGRRLLGTRIRRRDAEQTLARWLHVIPMPSISVVTRPEVQAQADVIEGTWHEIHEEGDQQ